MKRAVRQEVYEKYNGRCAYCGKSIKFEDMQVDHMKPKCNGGSDDIKNLYPSCRRCNHYKRGDSLQGFRRKLSTLRERVEDIYICKVAIDYAIINIKEWPGVFYYEVEDHIAGDRGKGGEI